jgi:RHS repeat-associated protein
VDSANTTQIGTDSVEVVLVDRRTTTYGSGWWPAGVPKLVAAGSDRLLVGASGAATVYRGNGDSLYVSPPGDFSVLTKTASGWQLSPRGSTAKLVFDGNGRPIASVDQNGNRDSIAYNGATDQVTALLDPVGKTITFGYDGNGKLSTLTDPGGRQTKVSISGTTNQLTYDSLSSPTSRAYTATYAYVTYPGTNTVALAQRIGVISDTTIVTYDSTFTRRPTKTRLAQVRDENGNVANPVINYTAYERQGYGALVSLDSLYVRVSDALGHWTASLLNRWGEARTTWDTLGLIGRTSYTAEGFVLWSEGKVPDSSRVYHSYDTLGRLARTYITRGGSDLLRLDSLVYDANHRVIQEIDPRGNVSQTVYDANGNVTQAITANNDTTRFWYGATGLVDSVRAPGNTASRSFKYDATWKNLLRVVDEAGITVDSAFFDAVGRDTAHMSEVRVQVSGNSTAWQWRLQERYYNAGNQTDSTRLVRADNCGSCGPPNWAPLVGDTLHSQRVGHRFDRAGRDSLRLNDRGKGVLYLYDRLGRLLSRRPWTDSLAVRDSFAYDVAGNAKKTFTRRGDSLMTNYDSRNRDTLTVIPGVGALRKTYGGPLDQLTRAWYDTPVDSIGGVNTEVRWGFDSRGRLKADTSYAGTVARATSYTYDTYERLASRTDPQGTWQLRYETKRGYTDTLLTPYADTVSYSFDAQSRAVGPRIVSGTNPIQSQTGGWGQTGTLDNLSRTVLTTPSYIPLEYDRQVYLESGPPLVGAWLTQDGASAPIDTLRDSVTYDGWERVQRWGIVGDSGIQNPLDSLAFDRTGNIHGWIGIKGGQIWFATGEVYDATTDRLIAIPSHQYIYDRLGNLVTDSSGTRVVRYGYDGLNHLRSVWDNGTLIARYAYDVLGRRIVKRVYSTALTGSGVVSYTRFVYHGAAVAFETDSGGTSIGLGYTWGPAGDDLLAIHDAAGNQYYVVQDELHSVRGLVRRDGTWIRRLLYDAYARVLKDTASAAAPTWELRYRWTGREYDSETGWYYFRARYFDPSVRRFVQEDPIGYGGGGNVYAYANGGPLEARDPSGMKAAYDAAIPMNGWQEPTCDGGLPCGGGGGGGGGLDDFLVLANAAFTLGVDINDLEDLLRAAATLVTAGGISVTYADGHSVDFALAHGVAGGQTSLGVFVEVFIAAGSTPGVTSVDFSSAYRDKIPGQGTDGLFGSGTHVWTHYEGLAVDIYKVDGKLVGDASIRGVVSAFEEALRAIPDAAEVYGPAGSSLRIGSPSAVWSPAGPITQATHGDHIHYSTYNSLWGTGWWWGQ